MKCKNLKCENVVAENKTRTQLYCSKSCKNNQQVNSHRYRKKIELVEYKGGECEKCGYNGCYGALQFHHKDPSEKDFGFGYSLSTGLTMEELKTEADKCMLLCANCHSEIHSYY